MICDPVSSMSTEEHKPIYFVIVIFQQFEMAYTIVSKNVRYVAGQHILKVL